MGYPSLIYVMPDLAKACYQKVVYAVISIGAQTGSGLFFQYELLAPAYYGSRFFDVGDFTGSSKPSKTLFGEKLGLAPVVTSKNGTLVTDQFVISPCILAAA